MQEDSDQSWGNDPLYEGTTWTSKDVLIVLEMFKVLGHMGDGLENIILGLIASIMPANNSIAKQIDKTSKSNYFFQETIKSGHSMFSKLRIYEISVCRKGCCAYIGNNVDLEICPYCDNVNEISENDLVYYFPLRDRLRKLLVSDLKRFLTYSKIRRPPTEGFLEDIYDGENWKWFEDQMNIAR